MRTRKLTVREKLANLLEAEGFTVNYDDLTPVKGAWRTDARLDVYRWEGQGLARDRQGLHRGMGVMFASWDTMTLCVRNGIQISRGDSGLTTCFLIHAKGH